MDTKQAVLDILNELTGEDLSIKWMKTFLKMVC